MRLLHRASSWRQLFAEDALPDPRAWPALLTPLKGALLSLGSQPTLAEAKAWQPMLVDALIRLDIPAWRISQLLGDHNAWLYRCAINLSLEEMQATGWGDPPVAFCVLTLGSVARHECLLGPDQDNAMILAEYSDAEHDTIDSYFQSLGYRFGERLHEAGIPRCHAHVMARWPMWRKRLSEWRKQLDIWTAQRRVKRVQQANILFDFAPVYGDSALARELREHIVWRVPSAHLFLGEMRDLLDETPVALGRLGRLMGDGKDAPHRGVIDLKRQGLIPLQNAVRLLAVANGCSSGDTRGRLTELVALQKMGAARAMALKEALDRLQERLLKTQMDSLAQGRAPDYWVNVSALSSAERLLLRHDLQQIKGLLAQASRAD
ncbi:signal transduction protein [Pistricoccus aurantiacus]|uniref:Signal transduction protein n=1 Tax=Pistricoccus aurantiacus TaxID=1883414 RepID=A0A5B8SRF7_9GAMM|nr:DUF294 nucleotidyltransferase-like domain-containing protein [Pistricoccus aurantiacus]QEA39759.1 signal transduction protein [Pistricoccus aurantiacus]